MAKKKSAPPSRDPFFIGDTLNPRWANYFEQFSKMAATQADATAAAADPPTQAEFNDLVSKFNALIDKLQAAGVME
jgi:hypothetical protein